MRLLQVRELLEERAQLQSENKDLDHRIRGLQEKANESAALRSEVHPSSSVGLLRVLLLASGEQVVTKECKTKCAPV